jgi:hypothetical protein
MTGGMEFVQVDENAQQLLRQIPHLRLGKAPPLLHPLLQRGGFDIGLYQR